MLNNISFEGQVLTIGGQQSVLPRVIKNIIVKEDVVIVRMEYYTEKGVNNRNIWAFDRNCNNLWKVPAAPHEVESVGKSTYVSVQDRNDEIWAKNWNGFSYRIDPITGEIIDYRFEK